MPKRTPDILQGTLDVMILHTLQFAPRHGYGIARAIERACAGELEIEEGSLYPALYRMERQGWIEAEWGTSELGRKARFYRLTQRGRKQLVAETERFAQFVAAVSPILLPG